MADDLGAGSPGQGHGDAVPLAGSAAFAHGGVMGALVRAHDWASSPLGLIEAWPQSLRTAVSLTLEARQPVLLTWGPQLTVIYNDAYIPIVGERHPRALGQPYAQLWAEFWDELEPLVAPVLRGEAQWFEDMPFMLGGMRGTERRWFSFSFTPVRADDGSVAGFFCAAIETTAKVQGDLRRAASMLRQRRLFQQAPGFIAILSGPEHVFEFVNDSYVRLLGDRPLVGRAVREAIPEVEGQGFFELLDQVYATGERYVASHLSVHLQPSASEPASERFVDFIYAPTMDEAGNVTGIFVEGQDVTDAHLAQQAVQAHVRRQALLMELSDRFRDVEELADLSFATGEILGQALSVSRAGYGTIDPVAETITIERDWNAPGIKSLAGVLHFRDYGSYIEDLKRGDMVVFADAEKDSRTASNADALKAISAQAAVNLPVIEQGRSVALIYLNHATAREWAPDELAFLREVAERTRAVIERRRAERELRALAASLERQVERRTAERDRVWNNSRDLLAVMRRDGVFLRVNPAWTTVLGYDRSELEGRSYSDFVWSDDAKVTEDALRVADAEQDIVGFENRYRHLDGTPRWIAWHTITEGDLLYAYGREITAQKEQAETLRQTEELLRQAQKMEAVGQLTGGLAHDFNNLLAGIGGALDLLQIRIAQGRTGDLERYITAAQGASKRAAALTHRLLAFSRRQTLEPKPTDINQLASGMEELVRRTVGPHIELAVVGTEGLWRTSVDPHQLENALLNLCINARDAMPDGGRLTIESGNHWLDVRAARVRDLPPGQYVSLCVSDTGAGMPPEVIERAFDPFFTTKPLGLGTGLGLSMIYGFAKQSGGQVHIHSTVGEGTTVRIYLPRYYGEEDIEQGQAPAPQPVSAREGETVLVVDDEPTVRMLLVEVLQDSGYQVIEAPDGAVALKVLESRRRIDLLITDVGLPGGMNGRQVADAARSMRPGLKVLFITGYAENAVIGNGQLDASMQVLTKPFAIEDLNARVKALLAVAGS